MKKTLFFVFLFVFLAVATGIFPAFSKTTSKVPYIPYSCRSYPEVDKNVVLLSAVSPNSTALELTFANNTGKEITVPVVAILAGTEASNDPKKPPWFSNLITDGRIFSYRDIASGRFQDYEDGSKVKKDASFQVLFTGVHVLAEKEAVEVDIRVAIEGTVWSPLKLICKREAIGTSTRQSNAFEKNEKSFSYASKTIQLKYRRTIPIKLRKGEPTLLLKFIKVLEDTRCPKDALCIQANTGVKVALQVRKVGEKRSETVELFLSPTESERVGREVFGYWVELLAVKPEPKQKKTIAQRQYVLTIKVSKGK